jgi:protease I
VRHGRLVTGQTWQSHPEFYREVLTCLDEAEPAPGVREEGGAVPDVGAHLAASRGMRAGHAR